MSKLFQLLSTTLCLVLWADAAVAALPQDLRPGLDADVVERLPERVGVAPTNPEAAATAARRWITLSRESGLARPSPFSIGTSTP